MKMGNFTKVISAISSAACAAGLIGFLGATVAAAPVEINEETFPDEAFRNYVKEKIDTDNDGTLSDPEINKTYEIDFQNKKATSLKGIEYFTSLSKLYCEGNNLTELDLSKNTGIALLYCAKNKIGELELSGLKSLEFLDCSSNQLTKLDISANKKLVQVEANKNKITEITLESLDKLTYFMAYSNDFKKIDITKCPLLLHAYTDGEKNTFGSVRNGKMQNFVDYCYEDQRLAVDDYVEIVVDDPNQNVIEFDLDDADANNDTSVQCGKVYTCKVKGDAEDVKWTTSAKKSATIDESGKLTPVRAGSVTITATVGEKTVSRTIRILYKDLTDNTKFWFTPTYYLTDNNVVKGYNGQTEFRGTNNCTRAQMVTFIWRLMGEPAPKTDKCKFSDVKAKDYFYTACIWGNENHIVEGYSDNTFRPQVVCARRHAVTFLWRLAGSPEPEGKISKFTDISDTDYFYEACIWANEKKILEGYSDDTFRPNEDCLRRQMTTFLYKYDKFVNGKG